MKKPILICLDGLQISFINKTFLWNNEDDIIELTPFIVLKKIEYKNDDATPKQHHRHYILSIQGNSGNKLEIGFLNTYNRPMKNSNDCACRVKINNWVFYDKWLPQIMKIMFNGGESLVYQNIIRLDIAYNTNENLTLKARQLYDKLRNSDNPNGTHVLWGGGNMMAGTYEGGSQGYRIKKIIGIYDKTKKLMKEDKSYQHDSFEANGLTGNVWRLEATFSSKDIKAFEKWGMHIDIEKIHQTNVITTILNLVIEHRLGFRSVIRKRDTNYVKELFIPKIETDYKFEGIITPRADEMKLSPSDKGALNFIAFIDNAFPELNVLDQLKRFANASTTQHIVKLQNSVMTKESIRKYSQKFLIQNI